MGEPYMRPNPVVREETHGMDQNKIPVEGGWLRGRWLAATAVTSIAAG